MYQIYWKAEEEVDESLYSVVHRFLIHQAVTATDAIFLLDPVAHLVWLAVKGYE